MSARVMAYDIETNDYSSHYAPYMSSNNLMDSMRNLTTVTQYRTEGDHNLRPGDLVQVNVNGELIPARMNMDGQMETIGYVTDIEYDGNNDRSMITVRSDTMRDMFQRDQARDRLVGSRLTYTEPTYDETITIDRVVPYEPSWIRTTSDTITIDRYNPDWSYAVTKADIDSLNTTVTNPEIEKLKDEIQALKDELNELKMFLRDN